MDKSVQKVNRIIKFVSSLGENVENLLTLTWTPNYVGQIPKFFSCLRYLQIRSVGRQGEFWNEPTLFRVGTNFARIQL